MSLDCYRFINLLKNNFKENIVFQESIYQKMGNGNYYLHNKVFCFNYIYQKNNYFIIEINSIEKEDFSLKLVALSNFYRILKEEFGEASLFYSTKRGFLSFYWDFTINKDNVKKFKDICYCNSDIEQLIVIGRTMLSFLDEETKTNFFNNYNLPIDLLNMVDEDFLLERKK